MNSVKTRLTIYRLKTALQSLIAIYRLPQEHIDAFIASYELFDKTLLEENDELKVIHYYRVLNHLCAIGEVEKMYIPAAIDVSKGIFENQVLFETKMSHDLSIKPQDKVLDIGCGRGRVAAHLASITGAKVIGLNIDEVQLNSARKFASISGLVDNCFFLKASLNDPFPFTDAYFDALYQIQVLTYSKNKARTFAEMFRVLKPGGKLSFLDWVLLDKFEPDSKHHRNLLKSIKPLIGAVDTPTSHDIKHGLEHAGFNILISQDASVGGHQADLIAKADKFFNHTKNVIHSMTKLRLIPQHFRVLIDRFTQDGEAFIEADRLGIVTTSFQTVAEKPLE